MSLLLSWAVLSIGLWIVARVVPGFVIRDFKAAALVAAVFGVLHWLIGWFLYVAIGVATLGIPLLLGLGFLIRWLVTALVLKLTDALMSSLTIRGFAPAFWGALLLSVLSAIKDYLFH